jgi:hypothetical protein
MCESAEALSKPSLRAWSYVRSRAGEVSFNVLSTQAALPHTAAWQRAGLHGVQKAWQSHRLCPHVLQLASPGAFNDQHNVSLHHCCVCRA